MATIVPPIEAAAGILVTYFQYTKLVEYDTKEAVDKYFNYINKNLEKVEDMRKYLIPPDAPVSIVYQIRRAKVKQFTKKLFYRVPKIGQDTSAFL